MSIKSTALKVLATPSLVACIALLPAAAQAERGQVQPRALELLKKSMSFLGAQQRFAMDIDSSIEVVLRSGQKIQFDNAIEALVKRPDKMFVRRRGDLVSQEFFYDGNSLTLLDIEGGMHATVDAPGNLDAMLDFARETLDIVAPAGDFIHADAYGILTEDVDSGFVVGTSFVEGAVCDHLAFSAAGTDWQIWIEQGDNPLPRRLVITSRDVLSAPQFSVHIRDWDLAPEVSASDFSFRESDKTMAISFITANSPGQ